MNPDRDFLTLLSVWMCIQHSDRQVGLLHMTGISWLQYFLNSSMQFEVDPSGFPYLTFSLDVHSALRPSGGPTAHDRDFTVAVFFEFKYAV